MNKKITYYLSKTQWCLLLISGLLLQPLMAQQPEQSFPYFQSFMNGEVPQTEIRTEGDSVKYTSEGLLLTPPQQSQFGAAILNSATFTAGEGLKIEFEYGMYGGTGVNGEVGAGGDGISVFLFDALAYNNSFEIGTEGEGLAYMYNRTRRIIGNTYHSGRKRGLSGAYLGIGLDAHGKFQEGSFTIDKRKNGLINHLPGNNNKNHVTLRGAAGKESLGRGLEVGYNGYPVLVTKSTLHGVNKGAVLNPDGSYTNTSGSAVSEGESFTLNTTSLGTTPNDVNYRKAFIELIPASTNGDQDGYYVTVKIQHSNTISTVIDNYHYKKSFTYTENAFPWLGDDFNVFQGDNETFLLNAAPPANFKIGFGASTGSATNNHLIRNLKVEILYAAEAEDDEANLSCEELVEIDVLENDFAYEGIPAVADSEYIDKTKFNFIDEDGNTYASSYTQDGVGVWSYDSDTGLVTFTKAEGFEGEASIQYSIIGRTFPYDGDNYRSLPATITVNVEHCVCTVEGNTSVPALVASTGITTLNRNSNTWLEDVNQGVNLVLESSTKPFIITRVVYVSNITDPVEGMLVWETSTSSLRLYKASGWSTLREGCNKPVLRTNQ